MKNLNQNQPAKQLNIAQFFTKGKRVVSDTVSDCLSTSDVKFQPSQKRKLPESMAKHQQQQQKQQKKPQHSSSVEAGEDETLSLEQKFVLERAVNHRESIFFTGSAGTGKSYLLRAIVRQLRKKYRNPDEEIAITSSTGIAAVQVDGVTLHSFAGMGLAKDEPEVLLKRLLRNPVAVRRWTQCRTLIIDEISLVDAAFFDTLEFIARKVRKCESPFGGIHVVIVGDFFQLPPVQQNNNIVQFCFEAKSWRQVIQHQFALSIVFRQKEQKFIEILNQMRINQLQQSNIDLLKSLSRPLEFDDRVEPTELFAVRQQVDRANWSRMQALSGGEQQYIAADFYRRHDDQHSQKRIDNLLVSKHLTLKVDAQVMLVQNMDQRRGLVNGAVGRVVDFEQDCLQGTDIPHGQAYPVVQFPVSNTRPHPVTQVIKPYEWKMEDGKGNVVASRTQVPLILAWAISIHKAQGQTIERLRVDLSKVFERGQAYVAISRATSLAGIQLLHFDERKVMAHEKVINFYQQLEPLADIMRRMGAVTEEYYD